MLRVREEEVWKKDWQYIIAKVHANAVSKTQAVSLSKEGELIVKAANPFWLQELRFFEEEIKELVQARSKLVKKIRFIA